MLCCQIHCGFLLVDHNDRTDRYTIVGCVTGGQSISDKANSGLGNLWNIIPSSTKLFEEQEMNLQIKDSGVAYFFLEFTENKLCILKILMPKNKAGTGRITLRAEPPFVVFFTEEEKRRLCLNRVNSLKPPQPELLD